MTLKRQIYRRSETIERIKVRITDTGEERLYGERRLIEGEQFHCKISRGDGSSGQSLFECDLKGKIEIEQLANGEFRLTCMTADVMPLLSE